MYPLGSSRTPVKSTGQPSHTQQPVQSTFNQSSSISTTAHHIQQTVSVPSSSTVLPKSRYPQATSQPTTPTYAMQPQYPSVMPGPSQMSVQPLSGQQQQPQLMFGLSKTRQSNHQN